MTGFAGFDCLHFPGVNVTSWLKINTNLTWCGFYLAPAPSQGDASWMPQKSALASQGWGLAPIYVGQQVTGPGSHHSSLAQGASDGNDATSLMRAAGFDKGSYVYLDLENGPPLTDAQRDYVAGWVDAVQANTYNAGVYCSHTFALDIHTLRSNARIWAFKVDTTAKHPVPGTNFPALHPAGSGYTGAFAWQLGQNCLLGVPPALQGTLQVDLDTAVQPDPSV